MDARRLKRRLAGAGLLLGVFALAGSAAACTSPETAPQLDKQAPDFTLDTMGGEEITLSELRGTPVVLNFWAIYCPACRVELVDFEELAEQNGDMAVIVVNTGDSRSRVEQFFGDYELHFTVALDEDRQVSSGEYNVRYLPTTFFIDRKGIIRYIKIGAFTSEAGLEEALASIR